MATAWYCVDEEGNVGVFEIEDNGPKPEGWEEDLDVNDLFWYDFSCEGEDGIKDLCLTPEQIKPLLKPLNAPDKWEHKKMTCTSYLSGGRKEVTEHSYFYNASWNDVIIKIDMEKLQLLLQAVSRDKDDIVCLSRNDGYFFVDFSMNQEGVELLEKHNVVLARYHAPYYYYEDWETDTNVLAQREDEYNRMPIFIYQQDYWPSEGAATRMSNPANPMKKEQLPQKIRVRITQLPVKFREAKTIQLAEFLPVYIMYRAEYSGDDDWYQICSSNGETEYYGINTHKILTKEEMDELIATGKVKERD
jgi:hypothetical protein